MASIYTYEAAETITEGLQGCTVCAEAIRCATELATKRGERVVLEDDDGCWLVDPDGSCVALAAGWAG